MALSWQLVHSFISRHCLRSLLWSRFHFDIWTDSGPCCTKLFYENSHSARCKLESGWQCIMLLSTPVFLGGTYLAEGGTWGQFVNPFFPFATPAQGREKKTVLPKSTSRALWFPRFSVAGNKFSVKQQETRGIHVLLLMHRAICVFFFSSQTLKIAFEREVTRLNRESHHPRLSVASFINTISANPILTQGHNHSSS